MLEFYVKVITSWKVVRKQQQQQQQTSKRLNT